MHRRMQVKTVLHNFIVAIAEIWTFLPLPLLYQCCILTASGPADDLEGRARQ